MTGRRRTSREHPKRPQVASLSSRPVVLLAVPETNRLPVSMPRRDALTPGFRFGASRFSLSLPSLPSVQGWFAPGRIGRSGKMFSAGSQAPLVDALPQSWPHDPEHLDGANNFTGESVCIGEYRVYVMGLVLEQKGTTGAKNSGGETGSRFVDRFHPECVNRGRFRFLPIVARAGGDAGSQYYPEWWLRRNGVDLPSRLGLPACAADCAVWPRAQ